MRIGIGIGNNVSGPDALDKVLRRIQKAERDGFHAAWLANSFSLDAITTLAIAGRETSTIEVGTFVVPTYPRHPVALAQQAMTTSLAAPGRFTLGIGLSHRVIIEDMYGLDYSRPIRHMREYLTVLNGLFAGEQVDHSGDDYRVSARLAMPGVPAPSLVVAALGPQMLRLAGRLANGTATWMGGRRYLGETAVPTISGAALEAGRRAPRVVAGIPVAVTPNADDARAAALRNFANYANFPSYRAVLEREGLEEPGDIAIVGDEATVRARLRELAEAGATDLHASPFRVPGVPGDDDVLGRTWDTLASFARDGL